MASSQPYNLEPHMLAQFFEFSPVPSAIFNREMCYITANTRWYEAYNLVGKEIIGKSHYEVFPEIPPRWHVIHQDCLRGAVLSHEADPFVRANGKTDYIKWTVRPWYEADNITVGGLIMYTEIVTKQVETEKARHKFEARYDALTKYNPEFVVFLDKDGIIEEINNTPAGVREQVVGLPYSVALQTDPLNDNPEEPVILFKNTIQTGRVNHYFSSGASQKRPGTVGYYDSYIVPVYENNTIVGAVIIATDISDTRHAQLKLEETVRELNQSLLFKDQFLATMSHELRTPMNAIMGYSSLALVVLDIEPELKKMVERIWVNSHRLLTLINDILDISRINAGRIEIVNDDFNLHELMYGWKKDYNQLALKKGLQFICQFDPAIPVNVVGDSERITQIVANLVTNAIKFTEEGSVILDVHLHEDDNNRLEIIVTDTGIGIEETWHELIFDEFRQVDMGSQRIYGGAGLGLSIVQKLCSLMGGTVWVDSKIGEGSTFTVTLPITRKDIDERIAS